MRRWIGLLLTATALLPAAAPAQERGGQGRRAAEPDNDRPARVRAERPADAPAAPAEARPERGSRDGSRPGFGPGGSRADRGDGGQRPDRGPRGGYDRPGGRDRGLDRPIRPIPLGGYDQPGARGGRDRGVGRPIRPTPLGGFDQPGSRTDDGVRGDRNGRGRWIGRDPDGVWRDRNPDWNRRDRPRDRVRDVNRDRSGWEGGWRERGDLGDRRGWNRNWREDNRYDWQRFRLRDRSRFRLPRYYAPYGWGLGYRRFAVGVTIDSALWGENYWIDDPYSYRLPPVYGPYRWVRYYNDALLVDVRSGYVVDAIHDIFW